MLVDFSSISAHNYKCIKCFDHLEWMKVKGLCFHRPGLYSKRLKCRSTVAGIIPLWKDLVRILKEKALVRLKNCDPLFSRIRLHLTYHPCDCLQRVESVVLQILLFRNISALLLKDFTKRFTEGNQLDCKGGFCSACSAVDFEVAHKKEKGGFLRILINGNDKKMETLERV